MPATTGSAAVSNSQMTLPEAPAPEVVRERKAAALAAPPSPEVWLDEIRQLRADGEAAQADSQLRRFLETYPDYFKKILDRNRERASAHLHENNKTQFLVIYTRYAAHTYRWVSTSLAIDRHF